jgi:hypothetical protein
MNQNLVALGFPVWTRQMAVCPFLYGLICVSRHFRTRFIEEILNTLSIKRLKAFSIPSSSCPHWHIHRYQT